MIHIELAQPAKVELVDEEIIALAGVDLGFILPGKPPQILQVDASAEHLGGRLRTDDVLVAVDGNDTRAATMGRLEGLLRTARRLTFERPGAAEEKAPTGATAPATDEQEASRPPSVAESDAPLSPEKEDPVSSLTAAALGEAKRSGAKAESRPELAAGVLVRLVGFNKTSESVGRLGKYSEKRDLWQVFLEATAAPKAVRPRNLEALPLARQPAEVQRAATPHGITSAENKLRELAAAVAAAREAGHVLQPPGRPSRPEPWQPPAFDGPGPPTGPEWFEDVVPVDEDKDAWVELLRDSFVQSLRRDAEVSEPPPLNRAVHWALPRKWDQVLPEGKLPAQTLNHQIWQLLRYWNPAYTEPGQYGQGNKGSWSWSGKGGGKGPTSWQTLGKGKGYGAWQRGPRWERSGPWSPQMPQGTGGQGGKDDGSPGAAAPASLPAVQ